MKVTQHGKKNVPINGLRCRNGTMKHLLIKIRIPISNKNLFHKGSVANIKGRAILGVGVHLAHDQDHRTIQFAEFEATGNHKPRLRLLHQPQHLVFLGQRRDCPFLRGSDCSTCIGKFDRPLKLCFILQQPSDMELINHQGYTGIYKYKLKSNGRIQYSAVAVHPVRDLSCLRFVGPALQKLFAYTE